MPHLTRTFLLVLAALVITHNSAQGQSPNSPRKQKELPTTNSKPTAVEPVKESEIILPLTKIIARAGDTPAKIAMRHNVSAEEVAQLNQVGINTEFQAGQEIKIPVVAPDNTPDSLSPLPIPTDIKDINGRVAKLIAQSEARFKEGELYLKANERLQARRKFDTAMDIILESGLDVRATPKLHAYYLDLAERIYRLEVPQQKPVTPQEPGFKHQKLIPVPQDKKSKLVLTSPSPTLQLPYKDVGACPFECCTYRQWVANEDTIIYKEMRDGSPIAFIVQRREKVTGITGVVITTEAGQVKALRDTKLEHISVKAGDVLQTLTYLGEGYYRVWYQGKFTTEAFYEEPSLKVLSEPQGVWWVKIKNRKGQIGWTRLSGNFDNQDACGGTPDEQGNSTGSSLTESIRAKLTPKRSRAATLPPRTIKIPADLAKQLLQDNEPVRNCLKESYEGNESKLFRHFTAKQIDLNNDNQSEYIIEASDVVDFQRDCFGDWRGHSDIWIYHKRANGYERLLQGVFSVGIHPLNTSTNGYRDLKGAGHNGLMLVETIYKFNGNRYRAAECLTYEFVETRKGVSAKLVERDDCSGYPGIKDN